MTSCQDFISLLIFFGREACGILVPQPGIELAPPAFEVWSLDHWTTIEVLSSVQSLKSCLALCNPMDCSMLGLAVHHQFLELAQ